MTPRLPQIFRDVPLTHRALHDVSDGRPENSRAAIRAAVDHGYGIEIDLQLSSDEEAMVFHDYDMARLTGRPGPIRQMSASDAGSVALTGGDGEGAPTLREVLDLVAGQVPLLIELKDQDGAMGPNIGALERATVDALKSYDGCVAVMSFNPYSVAELARCAPDVPRGLVTEAFPDHWPLPADTRARLRDIPDFDWAQACFISHDVRDLTRPRVAELKSRGVPVLCWTVRSLEQELQARVIADNITFEGYLANHPT